MTSQWPSGGHPGPTQADIDQSLGIAGSGRSPGEGWSQSGGGQPQQWTPTSPPGYGENWFKDNAYKWNQPGAASQYWNGVAGNFVNPSDAETSLSAYGKELGGTRSPIENLYDQYNNVGQFTATGSGEQWNARHGGEFTGPNAGKDALGGAISGYGQRGASENIYDQYSNDGTFANHGANEDWFSQNGGAFTARNGGTDALGTAITGYGRNGAMESFAGAHGNDMFANNNLAQHQGGIASDINSARNTGDFFGQTAGDLARPGYAESLASQYDPNARTYNEQFLLGGGASEGLDAMYSRLQDVAGRKLDNRAAAGGGFNTGAALRANEELGADMNAQHIKDYMTASTAADASRNAYQQYGLGLTSAADSGMRGRIQTGLSGANMVDTNALGRAKAGQDLYSGISDEARGNYNSARDTANDANTQALNRLAGMTNAGNDLASQTLSGLNSGSAAARSAQDSANQRVNTSLTAANDANTQALNRLSGMTSAGNDLASQTISGLTAGSNSAISAQDAADRRVNTGLAAASDSSKSWMDRLTHASDIASTNQGLANTRYVTGGILSGQADTSDLNRLTGGQNAATGAQNSQQNRENSVYNNLHTQANDAATVFSNANNMARGEQSQYVMEQINGMLAAGKIKAEEVQAQYGSKMATLGLIIQGGKVIASGGKG